MDKEKGNRKENIYIYVYIILELTEDVRRDGRCRAPLTTREGNQQRACGVRRRVEQSVCKISETHTLRNGVAYRGRALVAFEKVLKVLCEITN